MKRVALILHVGFFLGCMVGGQDSGDSGGAVADTSTRPPRPVDTGNETNEAPGISFMELNDPCRGSGTPYGLYFEDEKSGWVGCGNGIGLWKTDDAGQTFTSGHPNTATGDLYVNQIVGDPNGGVLICGHDYADTEKTLLYRYRDGQWEDLLHYGNNASDETDVYLANCGQVAAAGDGTLIVAGDTAGDITWSTNDGKTWADEERYWEEANFDGYSYYYMLNLRAEGGVYFGAGSDITTPPMFFGPSADPRAEWYNFLGHVVDMGIIGEVWSLDSPDGGLTWYVGGRDQRLSSQASGFLERTIDGGETWERLALGPTIDIVHDIAFSEDSLHGVAVGHRYPPNSLGGFILVTEDGGDTWEELDIETPVLQSAAIVGTTFWVAGDGFLGRGEF